MAAEVARPVGPYGAREDIVAGVGWMVLTTLLFVCVTGTVRHLGSSLPPAEGAFIRYGIGFLMICPAMRGLFRRRITRKIWVLYGARGLLHGVAVIFWFYAMARISLAEVTAIGYAAPIFVTVMAAIFLGERLRARRVAAIVIGLAGVLLILRPGFQEVGTGQLAQLMAAPLFAGSFILAKLLTDHADAGEIVAMLSLACTIALLPFALADWRDPTWREVGWLSVTALCATAGHYSLTRAYRCAPITVTQPVIFLQLVWATILGAVVFNEAVDIWIVAGAVVIVGSAWYIARREMIAKRAPTVPAGGAAAVASGAEAAAAQDR